MIRLRRRISGFGSQLQASSMPGDRGLSPCLRSEDRGLVENFPNPRAWSLWGQSQHALFRGFDQLWVVQQGVVLALVPVREHVTPVLTIRLARLAGCDRVGIQQLETRHRHRSAVAAERQRGEVEYSRYNRLGAEDMHGGNGMHFSPLPRAQVIAQLGPEFP